MTLSAGCGCRVESWRKSRSFCERLAIVVDAVMFSITGGRLAEGPNTCCLPFIRGCRFYCCYGAVRTEPEPKAETGGCRSAGMLLAHITTPVVPPPLVLSLALPLCPSRSGMASLHSDANDTANYRSACASASVSQSSSCEVDVS